MSKPDKIARSSRRMSFKVSLNRLFISQLNPLKQGSTGFASTAPRFAIIRLLTWAHRFINFWNLLRCFLLLFCSVNSCVINWLNYSYYLNIISTSGNQNSNIINLNGNSDSARVSSAIRGKIFQLRLAKRLNWNGSGT